MPDTIDRFEVGNEANTLIVGRLIICLLHLGRIQLTNSLIDILLKRVINDAEEEELFLEIGRTFYKMEYYNFGMAYMTKLLATETFARSADALFLCATFEQVRNNQENELALYKRILDIHPNFVNARINLSTILQRMGQADDALEALMECDLDLCAQLPVSVLHGSQNKKCPLQDERLLIRQAEVLQEQNRLDQYVRCVRMILVPYFYAIYKYEDFSKRNRKRSQCNVLYRTMLEQLRDSPIEKQIKRQGLAALTEKRAADLTHESLHDYCLKLVEILQDQKRYREMMEIICLAALEPKISNSGFVIECSPNNIHFQNADFLQHDALCWHQGWTLLACFRVFAIPSHTLWGICVLLTPINRLQFQAKTADLESDVVEAFGERLYNALNYVLCHNQDVTYHRYIIRAETRSPGVKQLQAISGNNSLVTGSYRHALSKEFNTTHLNTFPFR